MTTRRLKKSFALLAAAGLVVAACGGDDDDTTSESTAEQSGDAGDATTEETSEETSEDTADAGGEETAEETAEEGTEDVIEAGEEASGEVNTDVEATDLERTQGGEITVGLEAELVGMRPWEDTCGSPCYNVLTAVYDKLMESTADGNYEGWLFEDMAPNEDFTVWTGTLRSGVTFHNGKEVTAQSVADMFPVQQTGSTSAGAIAGAKLTAVEATGDLEVTYTLSGPNAAFPAFLSRAPLGMVFDAALAVEDFEGYANAPIGTGPFMVESRDLDNETVVVRNESYWMTDQNGTQLPYLDKVVFRPIPDEGTRLDALLSGTTQVLHTLRQGTIRDARAARDDGADITMFEFQGNNVGGGMFNTLVPPFDDVRVRRALTHMNSQENVIEAFGGTGISLPGTQWFSPDSVWYSEKAAAAYPQFDFDMGVELLTEYVNDPARSDGKAAGEPIDTELSCPPDPTLIAGMQVLEQTWSASGLVNVNLTNYDQQTHINYALGGENGFVGDHTTHCWRVSSDEDPSTAINQAIAPPIQEIADAFGEAAPSGLNWSNWWNQEAYEAALAAIETDDFDERYALYETVMTLMNEDMPIWYSGHTATALGVAANIDGLASWELPNGSLGAGLPNAEGRWGQAFIIS